MYELIIKNGKIIDGTGSPSYLGDIAIKDGKISAVGKALKDAEKVIDATGLTVTPGFIDSHSHSDSALFTYPDLIEKIEQGITTSIAGQCGTSPAPVPESDNQNCIPMGAFLDFVKNEKFGSNTMCLVGHGTLRKAVMGSERRKPTAEELCKMKELLRDGMEHGALGISFGLIYAPGDSAETDELIEIAKVAGEYHGIVAAHIRSESKELVKAVEEFIKIVKESGARGVLSHHKACGNKENWGKVSHTLRMIDKANEEGVEIYCDVYPYTATHTTLSATVVPEIGSFDDLMRRLRDPEERAKLKVWGKKRFGEDFSWVQIATCKAYPEYEGLRVTEIARMRGTDEFDAMYDMIADSENVCSACYFTICEEDVETVMSHPRAMICTDAGVAKDKKVFHPRTKGTFPRTLGRYVRERKVTTLHEMIRKMTSMPAAVYGLKNKGLIWEGMDADICIFDAGKIIDKSDFTDCNQRAEGLNYVILNGKVVVENAVYNGKRAGNIILKI